MVPGRAKRSESAGAEGIVGFISSYCGSAALPDTATSECVIDFLPSQYENLWTSCGEKNKNKSRQARHVSYWHEKKGRSEAAVYRVKILRGHLRQQASGSSF